ncbi:hypothetical protein ZWY2020_041898 [Hordeum vulgare]|nr:hypothetical protein ZWY2020_041898 [Hordeum vulgare]
MAHLAPHLVDEILEEIFLRLPTPTALARASTACSSFRGIITARSFLRRYRALHPPPLLGFATEGGFLPAQDPHPSAPLARALVDGADFSYSYVPKPDDGGVFTPWCPRDVRDGRVLLVCNLWFRRWIMTICRSVLAVCDPLSRRDTCCSHSYLGT